VDVPAPKWGFDFRLACAAGHVRDSWSGQSLIGTSAAGASRCGSSAAICANVRRPRFACGEAAQLTPVELYHGAGVVRVRQAWHEAMLGLAARNAVRAATRNPELLLRHFEKLRRIEQGMPTVRATEQGFELFRSSHGLR